MSNYTIQDLEDNLDYLAETKRQMKQAISNKGVSVSDSDSFRSYASKIDSINLDTLEKPFWYFTGMNAGITSTAEGITNFRRNNRTNIITMTFDKSGIAAGNYLAQQAKVPQIGDLCFVNHFKCVSDITENVFTFGKVVSYAEFTDSSNLVTMEVDAYGGYKLD